MVERSMVYNSFEMALALEFIGESGELFAEEFLCDVMECDTDILHNVKRTSCFRKYQDQFTKFKEIHGLMPPKNEALQAIRRKMEDRDVSDEELSDITGYSTNIINAFCAYYEELAAC